MRDELVDTGRFEFPTAKGIRKPELDMAKALVNSLAAEWNASKYTDQYRENLMRVVKAKLKGKKIELEQPSEPRQTEVVDLMERLRRSLAQGGITQHVKAGGANKTGAGMRATPHN